MNQAFGIKASMHEQVLFDRSFSLFFSLMGSNIYRKFKKMKIFYSILLFTVTFHFAGNAQNKGFTRITTFDSSIAGLGGCPYAPGAKGNVSTEAVVDFLESTGFRTGIKRENLKTAAQFARSLSQ